MTLRKKTTMLVKLVSSVGTGFYYVTEKSRKYNKKKYFE